MNNEKNKSNNSKNKKDTNNDKLFYAAKRTFNNEYKTYITKELLEEFNVSYKTVADFKDSWQTHMNTSDKIKNFLELKTKIFVMIISKNPIFLKFLTKFIAEYLSEYYVRQDATKTTESVKHELQNMFFRDFGYVQNLYAKIKENEPQKTTKKEQPKKTGFRNVYVKDNLQKKKPNPITIHFMTKEFHEYTGKLQSVKSGIITR